MRKLQSFLWLIFVFAAVAQKRESCEKVFFKEKRSVKKSAVFGESKSLKTKHTTFFAGVKRHVGFSFERTEDGLAKLVFKSTCKANMFKQAIILDQNIKIAFLFNDGTVHIFKFTSNPYVETSASLLYAKAADDKVFYNSLPLTTEVLHMLATKTLVEVQLKNPFNAAGAGVVRAKKVYKKHANNIKRAAKCFKSKVTF